LDGSPARVVRPVAEGRIPAISLDPMQRRLTVSKFKSPNSPIHARPACVVEACQVYRKSVDAGHDRHPSV
jgi:hypothetical protein